MTLSANKLSLPDSSMYELSEVPAVLLGRIGIDNKHRGNKYAEKYLLPYAIGICSEVMQKIGCRLLIAEVKIDDPIVNFFILKKVF